MSRPYFIKLEAETIANENVQSVLNDHKLYKGDWIYPETVDICCETLIMHRLHKNCM